MPYNAIRSCSTGLPDRFCPGHPVLRAPAVWHPDPAVPREDWAIVLFRRSFELPRAARRPGVWVSASQRFILYLDGRRIARGPSRSDPNRWGAVRVPLGTLAAGRHVLAAEAVHFGRHGGIGQLGGPAFFLLCAEGEALDAAVRSGPQWRCLHDTSRSPLAEGGWADGRRQGVIGACERIDAAAAPWGWQRADYHDSSWPAAKVVCSAAADEWGNFPLGCSLRPEPLPPMDEREVAFARLAEAEGTTGGGGVFPLIVPARGRCRLLLDRGELTNAYPLLSVSGGRGAVIRAVWNEAPLIDRTWAKGNRDETAGKHIWGHLDEFLPDGGRGRLFTTLHFRPFRYAELTVATADEPLTLERFALLATGYPLRQRARFAPDAARRAACRKIWEVSWRTATLCAHETFFDCPHYEQAQFPGDSRVQAVFHYLLADDDALARKAIDDFRASRLPEGLTQCRWPSRSVQVLPTFSLYWIGMMHDFRVYRGEAEFLRPYVPFAREVLDWFLRRRRADGMLGLVEHAPFVDWTGAFRAGNAPQDSGGGSSILTLLAASACRWQAGLERAAGCAELAPRWRRLARDLTAAALRACWDARRGLLADTPAARSFSTHAQVEAVLAGAWPPAKAAAVLRRALADDTVAQPGTFYYRYYLLAALKAAGLRAELFGQLPHWEKLLDGTGLTTWPETDRGNPRSDCHAWSVAPAIEFLQTVLGVEPDPVADGFARVRFEPALGPLERASGAVPTPHGAVRVRLHRNKARRIAAEIDSPVPIILPGRRRHLRAGKHRLVL